MSLWRNSITLAEGRATVSSLQQTDVTVARLEDTGVVVGRDVPPATHHVVDMLALGGCTFAPACTQAELVVRHKVGPLADKVGFAVGSRIGRSVDDAADRVTQIVGAVRIKLSSIVTVGDQDAGEITHAGDLNVVPGPDKVCTLDRAVRNQTCAVSIRGAVSNPRTLLFSDSAVLGRTPETEIFERVDPRRLATRILVPRVARTRVVARLRLAARRTAFAGFDAVGTHVLIRKLRVGVGGLGLPLRPRLGRLVAVQIGGSARIRTVTGASGLLS